MNDKKRSPVYIIIRLIAFFILNAIYKIEIEGASRLPTDTAFVLLPKHQKWVDVPLVGLATPMPLFYVAKYELFLNPLSRWLMSSLGGIPLNRGRPIESRPTLHAIRRHLRQGSGFVVFPEGTYYPNRIGPGNLGILRFITLSANVPLIPVGINYSKRFFRSLVSIRFGTPIVPLDTEGPKDLLAIIMERIADQSGMTNFDFDDGGNNSDGIERI